MIKRIVFFLMLYMFPCLCNAKVTLPSLIGDNMVLQRNTVVKLWGKATPYSTVKIKLSWDNQVYETKAEASGEWVQNVRTTDAGGPYSITISDGPPVVLSNILLGEVWICAGQSNMEMPVQVALEDSAGTADSKAVLTVVMADREADIRSIISKVATWMICLMTFSEICS